VLQNEVEYCKKLKEDIKNSNDGKRYQSFYTDAKGVIRTNIKTRRSCIVVPQAVRADVLRVLHDHPLSSHMGFKKTLYKVRERFFWPGLINDVKRYIKGCETCQKIKSLGHILRWTQSHQ
jgi:hypothetical protein